MTANEPIWHYPLEDMEQGDSFFIPTLEPSRVSKEIKTVAKDLKVKVRVKGTVYDNIIGLRIWRTG